MSGYCGGDDDLFFGENNHALGVNVECEGLVALTMMLPGDDGEPAEGCWFRATLDPFEARALAWSLVEWAWKAERQAETHAAARGRVKS